MDKVVVHTEFLETIKAPSTMDILPALLYSVEHLCRVIGLRSLLFPPLACVFVCAAVSERCVVAYRLVLLLVCKFVWRRQNRKHKEDTQWAVLSWNFFWYHRINSGYFMRWHDVRSIPDTEGGLYQVSTLIPVGIESWRHIFNYLTVLIAGKPANPRYFT